MKKKGFTLIELLVVIAIIAMLRAILMPALNKVKKIAQRVICGTNLKGLGNAQMVYANDYDDEYAVQGGSWGAGGKGAAWSTTPMTSGWHKSYSQLDPTGRTDITVGASLYLLVREADVSPKSFVCPAGGEQEFTGKNDGNGGMPWDIVDLFDFGNPNFTLSPEGPMKAVSYAYHNPYMAGTAGAAATAAKGKFSATG
ncbi:MAG: prepilin-type N-terminal cleavage/methylation domain-containing protein [Anaerohalosphaeraceae bacterium]